MVARGDGSIQAERCPLHGCNIDPPEGSRTANKPYEQADDCDAASDKDAHQGILQKNFHDHSNHQNDHDWEPYPEHDSQHPRASRICTIALTQNCEFTIDLGDFSVTIHL